MANVFDATFDPAPSLFDKSRIVAIDGVETMCRPSRFVIDVAVPAWSASASDLSDLLQQPIGLHLHTVPDPDVVRDCLITGVEFLGVRARGEGLLRLVIEDAHALAGIGRRTKGYVAMSIGDIASSILSRVQAAAEVGDGAVQAPSIVQWQETDLAFMTRLLGRHGRFFYTRPGASAGAQQVIVGGTPAAYGSAGDAIEAEFRSESETDNRNGVRGISMREGLVPSTFKAAEHDSKAVATAETEGTVEAPDKSKVDATDYDHRAPTLPGRIAEAKQHAAAQAANRRLFTATSGYASLHAGRCLKLLLPDLADAPSEYLVLRVEHHWRHADSADPTSYVNTFTACAYDEEWHPWPIPPAPRVDGVRLAKVIANDVPAGDASPDGSSLDQGAYEIEFPSECDWDGTPLVQIARLSQPMAGNGRGLHSPPEVGDEVVVTHQDGDPDRPVIIGVLYNGSLAGPMVAVADGTTTSAVWRSHTGHELRFDDADGKERIHLVTGTLDHSLQFHDADKKVHLTTKGELIEDVDLDHTATIKGNRTESIAKNHTIAIDGNQAVTIEKDQTISVTGNRSLAVDGNQSATVTGGESLSVGKDRSVTVDGAETASVGKDYKRSVSGAMTLTVTKNLTTTVDGATSLTVTKDQTVAIKGASKTEVTKELAFKGKAIRVEAVDELTFVCGSAKVSLKKSGDITIEGGKISIKASGDLILKGSKAGIN